MQHTASNFRVKVKKLYFGFVDLEKTFDRVPREVISWAVHKLGVEEWLVCEVVFHFDNFGTLTFHKVVWQGVTGFLVITLLQIYWRTTTTMLHPFNGLFSRTAWVSRHQKCKTSLDLIEARGDVFGDAVASAGLYSNNLHRAPDITKTSSLDFYIADALPDVQSTVSMH